MKKKQNNIHNPEILRFVVFFLAFAGALISGMFSFHLAKMFLIYALFVNVLDLVVYRILKLKDSHFCNAKKLRKKEKVTLAELDLYYSYVRNVRHLSLGVGVLISLLFYRSGFSLEVFSLTYISLTTLGYIYLFLGKRTKIPKLIRLDNDYQAKSGKQIRNPACDTAYNMQMNDGNPIGPRYFGPFLF